MNVNLMPVSGISPLGTMNVQPKFHCDPTDSYLDISLRRSANVDLMLALWMNPSAEFLFWGPWTSFAQFDGDPVNGR